MTVSCTGVSVETLTLPHEDSTEHQRLYDAWITAAPGRPDPIEQGAIDQAINALIEKRRAARGRRTLRTERIRTAVLDFERDQEDYVAECLLKFNENCELGLRLLTRRAAGCRWAIAYWEKLKKMLAEDRTWYGAWRIGAIQLMGVSACLDELFYSEEAFTTWLDCLVAQPNPKQKDIDRILDPMCIPKAIEDRDLKLWPGNPEESRARLHTIVDRELPRLRALEETLRVQYEDPGRAEAQEMALARLAREELPLLRAELMHEQSYDRAVKTIMKLRKSATTAPIPTPVPAAARERAEPVRVPRWTVVYRPREHL